MSLRRTSYVVPRDPGGLKNAKRRFSVYSCTSLKESLQFLCVNTVSDKVVRHSLVNLSMQKWFAEVVPYYVTIWPKLTCPFKKRRFQMNIRS